MKGPLWLGMLRRYLLWWVALHLIWEIVQLPLYTLWRTGIARVIAVAVLHCTAGDLMIATLALVAALTMVGAAEDRAEARSVNLSIIIEMPRSRELGCTT